MNLSTVCDCNPWSVRASCFAGEECGAVTGVAAPAESAEDSKMNIINEKFDILPSPNLKL